MNKKNLISIHIGTNLKGKLVIDKKVRKYCLLPYPNHPNGCPNFGKKENCPPHAPYVYDYFDLNKNHFFIYAVFNIKEHIRILIKKHPLWSDRQLRCCLYWQPGVVKVLRSVCNDYIDK